MTSNKSFSAYIMKKSIRNWNVVFVGLCVCVKVCLISIETAVNRIFFQKSLPNEQSKPQNQKINWKI